ncbi:MAG TPA: hypothetical protein VFQ68_14980 [Streptosporangiaceae bacterium]|nr:hypothetical protein [Streptosporangiaceae bacterium]
MKLTPLRPLYDSCGDYVSASGELLGDFNDDAPGPGGGGEPPAIEEEVAAHERRAAGANQPGQEPGSSGSPMDL